MKRETTIATASLALVLVAVGGFAVAGIKGSKHDFSTDAWSQVDKCGVCHQTEREQPPALPPLWDARADLTKRFGKSALSKSKPGMGTLSCLRCHDGTIAKDATGAALHKERFAHTQHPSRFTTGHERSDHPVGVDYPNIDRDYHPATTVLSGRKVTLPGGKVECSSCHDPHDESGEEHMLVMSNARSALCLQCHKK